VNYFFEEVLKNGRSVADLDEVGKKYDCLPAKTIG
jgi:hypothetical protein